MMTDYKPKIRKEASLEFHHNIVQTVFKTLEQNSDKYFPFQSCINCEHFDEPNEICKKYNVRPPLRILLFACEMYEDNQDIPF